MDTNVLNKIQKIAKIGKIITKIVFIFLLIGFVGCLIGFITLLILKEGVFNYIKLDEDIDLISAIVSVLSSMFVCLFNLYLANCSLNYFKNELIAGDPFTNEGADELRSLGIKTIWVPVVEQLIVGIILAIEKFALNHSTKLDLNIEVSIGMGISIIIVSLLCRLGASQKNKAE